MTWALVAAAAPVSAYNQTLVPTMPAGFVAGNILIAQSQIYIGSYATPSAASLGAGWVQLSPGVNAKQVALWGKQAVGNDPAPTIEWAGNGANVTASAWVTAYSGGSLNLHASADWANTDTENLRFAALTITQPNCLVIAGGARDKTSASNAGSWGTPGAGSFAVRNSLILSGANIAGVMNDWIQTGAVSLSSQFLQSMGVADASAQSQESFTIALLPGSGGGGGGSNNGTLGLFGVGS